MSFLFLSPTLFRRNNSRIVVIVPGEINDTKVSEYFSLLGRNINFLALINLMCCVYNKL
jgi:hypothetical protein